MDTKERVQVDGLWDDGNVFAVMGKARMALRRAGRKEDADELTARVTSSGSYDAALAIIMEYVDDDGGDE